jgi:hypothetical protein
MLRQKVRVVCFAIAVMLIAQAPSMAAGAASTTSTMSYEVIYVKQSHPIQPAAISRTAGPVLVVIKNLTKLSTLNFVVTADPPPANAAAMAIATVVGGSLTFSLNLPAGHYVLVEQNNPQYRVTLEMK